MSALKQLADAWDSYQTTLECLKVVARGIKREDMGILGRSNFVGTPVDEAAGRISQSTVHADDYVILLLWAIFERHLMINLRHQSELMLKVSETQLTRTIQLKISNELEYWRIRARASARRCFMPRENCLMGLSPTADRPTRSNKVSGVACIPP